jgi:uncharacterized membrane protein
MFLTHNRSKVVTLILLIFIVGLGSFLRFYQIGKLSFWLDEAITFINSKGNLITAVKRDPNMSLYWFLAHYWIRIFPNASNGMLRALSAIFSIASIPAVFLLGKTMVADQKKAAVIGLIAAFLITINAYHIEYAQEFRSYSLTFLLTTLSTFLLIKTIEDPGQKYLWPIGYTLVTAAAVYSHLFALILVAAQAVSLPILFLDKKKRSFTLKRILFCEVGIAGLILPVAYAAYRQGSGQISWIPEPSVKIVKQFLQNMSGYAGGMSLIYLYLAFVCIGILAGLGVGSRQDLLTRWKFTLLAGSLFLPVVAALVVSKILLPVFISRYLLYVMTYMVVLAAFGIVTIGSFGKKSKVLRSIFTTAEIAGLVLCVHFSTMGIQSYYENAKKEDWRAATQFLATKCFDSLRLYYAPYMEVPAIYYNPSLISQLSPKWYQLSNNPNSNEIADKFPGEYDQVCLILSHDSDKKQEQIILDSILKKYPNVSTTFKFYGGEIEIFSR